MPVDGVLSGKVVVVTGAGRGIGKAIAVGYAAAGATVCCVARTESEIARTVVDIRSDGGTASSVQADVTDYDSVVHAFDFAISEFGGVDIVVINAGGNLDDGRDVESGNLEQWTDTVQLNLVGAYHTARAAIPHLKDRGGGKILAIGSGLGRRGRPGMSAYATAKAGLSMLVRVLAQELWQTRYQRQRIDPRPRPHRPRNSGVRPKGRLGLPGRQRVDQDPRRRRTPRPLSRHTARKRPHRADLQPHEARHVRQDC